MKHYKYLDTTSIFLALLGNRPSHCKIQLFFLQAIFSQHAKFKRIRAVPTHQCYIRCGPFWHKSKLAVSVPLLVILFPFTTIGSANLGSSQSLRWKENQVKMGGSSNQMILPIFSLTLASVLAAALTAVYSSRAKKTKKMQTPVHKSTA